MKPHFERCAVPHTTVCDTAVSDERVLSEADSQEIIRQLMRCAVGGGETYVRILSTWTGYTRWARNQIRVSGDDRDDRIQVWRRVLGAGIGMVTINDTSVEALVAANRQAEWLARRNPEIREADLETRADSPYRPRDEVVSVPNLFYSTTYNLGADQRVAAAQHAAGMAQEQGMLSAGYLEASATSLAVLDSLGRARYFKYTWAQYSETVRDPTGRGSGWAGVDWPDWTKIDAAALSSTALDKCLRSRNPVAIEPGRYVTILEPQAVCDFVGQMFFEGPFGDVFRAGNGKKGGLFYSGQISAPRRGDPRTWHEREEERGYISLDKSKLGERVLDERITISTDPMDPELGYPPYPKRNISAFEKIGDNEAYRAVTWIERGVLKQLQYHRDEAGTEYGLNASLETGGAFRMSGGPTTIAEMITTTRRGVLVTRFDRVQVLDGFSQLYRGYTRDGLWLIENGKIMHPVKNFMFVESPLFALNNVEQLGPPQRVFHPESPDMFLRNLYDASPVIVPPLKIRDFSFTALSDAV